MTYRYLNHLSWADVAFEVESRNIEELFRSAAEATLHVMVSGIESIRERETRVVELRSGAHDVEDAIDELLHAFLEKLIFYKDAERLLLKPMRIELRRNRAFHLRVVLSGERIDPRRHDLITDIKAVTLHQFNVQHFQKPHSDASWQARVVLDV